MKVSIKKLFISLLCLFPVLWVQGGGDVCLKEEVFLEAFAQEEQPGGLLKVYTTDNHAVLELHKQESGAWTESSYSLYPKDSDDEDETWFEWFAGQGSLSMVSTLLVAKALSALGLWSFAEPGYIAVNSSYDHALPVDLRPGASFELSKEQVLALQAFLAESIEAFDNGARMYDPDVYHCQDFVQEAMKVVGIDGGLYDHLPERSLLKGSGSVDVGSVSISYKKHGLLPSLWRFANEWVFATPEISLSGEDFGELFIGFYQVCKHTNGCLEGYASLSYNVDAVASGEGVGMEGLDAGSIHDLEDMLEASHAGAFHLQHILNVFDEGEIIASWPLNLYLQEHVLDLKSPEGFDNEVVVLMEIQEFQGNSDFQKIYFLQVEVQLPEALSESETAS